MTKETCQHRRSGGLMAPESKGSEASKTQSITYESPGSMSPRKGEAGDRTSTPSPTTSPQVYDGHGVGAVTPILPGTSPGTGGIPTILLDEIRKVIKEEGKQNCSPAT